MEPVNRKDDTLPATAEVGDEGGSYGDAGAGRMSIATETAARGPLATRAVDSDEDTSSGAVRYPTEPPSPPDASEGLRVESRPWRAGLVGFAAGTAALLGVTRLRRRKWTGSA